MFDTLFTEPILNGIVLIYKLVPGTDFAIAIVLLTIIVRTLLIPVAKKGIVSQQALQKIQPDIEAIRKKYKEDPQQMTKKTMAMYKEKDIHPLSGFMPLLIQIPVVFGLFRAIGLLFPRGGEMMNEELLRESLYTFVTYPEIFSTVGFGGLLPDLAASSIVLAVLAGIAQFIQSKLTFPKKEKSSKGKEKNMQSAMQTQMMYIFPFITVAIAASLPSALALYWFTATVFAAAQHYLLTQSRKTTTDK